MYSIGKSKVVDGVDAVAMRKYQERLAMNFFEQLVAKECSCSCRTAGMHVYDMCELGGVWCTFHECDVYFLTLTE